MDENVFFALLLTLLAGLSTGIGSLLALFTKGTNKRFLSVALGFSAGVMIFVSMVEIYSKAEISLTEYFGGKSGKWATAAAFFVGILLIALIDKLIPSADNPHEIRCEEPAADKVCHNDRTKLMRMGLFTAIAIAIHNFPEGLATFVAALKEPSIAISIAVAIAIHNIPEGIAVAIPIYYATGSRKKAFLYSFISGLAEPVGGVLGYLILRNFINDLMFGMVFAGVAGIMVFISLDELLPAAREYGEHHLSVYGLIAGMAVMSVSLILF